MRTTTSKKLRAQVEGEIISGALKPGDTIDEKSLSARFEVSRTPAREAILHLAASGLVKIVPRHGAVVQGVSPQLAIGMMETLSALEAEAASLAARRMSIEDRQMLRIIYADAEEAAKRQDSPEYVEHNRKFHQMIYKGASNTFLAGQIEYTRQRMAFYHRSSLFQPARVNQSWEEHGRVAEAILAGDEQLANLEMREHILSGGKVFADLVSTFVRSEADNQGGQNE